MLSCGKRLEQPRETILARIGPKDISVNEFIRRAEYTIRPKYCRGQNYIHKKIVLNSLIAEKLLALEAGDRNPLTENQNFRDYLRGRQEQAMRQWLYAHDFYEKVRPDSAEIRQAYELLGRKYRVAYFTVKDTARLHLLQTMLKEGGQFGEIYRRLGGKGEPPAREIRWTDPENEAVLDSLFGHPRKVGEVIGPIEAAPGAFVVLKVAGWTSEIAVGEKAVEQRWKDAVEKVKNRHAGQAFRRFVAKIMHGKTLKFNPDTFYRLARLFQPVYLKSDREKKEAFNARFWGKPGEFPRHDSIQKEIAKMRGLPFFEVDGKVWTVGDFERELVCHPLVFRKRRMRPAEFPEQFRLAVVDMVRDRYITQEAYRRGYDRVSVVRRNVEMWRDNLLALYQRDRYLESVGKKEAFAKEPMRVLREVLNPYVRSLQKKYEREIGINTDAFEKIKLTRIDMFVLQQGVPFPIVVPAFPVITTYSRLDYGHKMKSSS